MKNLGQRVRQFRQDPARNWSTARMADEVGTSRQNIENLEQKGFGQPRYIAKLAAVMGTSVDELLGRSAARPSNAITENVVVIEVNRDSAADGALTADELQDFVGAVRDLPPKKARELLAQLMQDAEEYRQYGRRVLARFGVNGVATNERALEMLPSAPTPNTEQDTKSPASPAARKRDKSKR